MRKSFLILIFLSSIAIYAQKIVTCPQSLQVDQLLDTAAQLSKKGDYKKSTVTVEEALRLSKIAACKHGELASQRSLMLIYAQQYQYKKALHISRYVEKIATELKDYHILTTLYGTRAVLYTNLGLYKEAIGSYKAALENATHIEDKDSRNYELGFINFNLSSYYQETSLEKVKDYLLKSKSQIEAVSNNSKTVPMNKKMDMLVSVNTNLGIFYYMHNNPDRSLKKAEVYYGAALNFAEKYKEDVGIDTKIDLYESLLEFYNGKKEYQKAILYGEKMLLLEKTYSMPYNRRVGYMVLAKAYLGAGKNEISKDYLDLYSKINDSITSVEKEAVEEPVKQSIKKNENNYSEKVRTIFKIAGILVLLVLAGSFFLWHFHKKKLKKKYEAVINNLQATHNAIPETPIRIEVEEDTNHANINISDDTLKTLLKRLEKFETSNRFTKQDVNFGYLSNYLGTNSKYLNNILKQYKGKTFSQYINDLRINYIIKQLYEKPKYREYKTSYLAEECGFSSREVFTTTFKKITGIPPSYFIENLKRENLENNTSQNSDIE